MNNQEMHNISGVVFQAGWSTISEKLAHKIAHSTKNIVDYKNRKQKLILCKLQKHS